MGTRKADFAGSWYPGTKRECINTIEDYMSKVRNPEGEYTGFGGIVPHAGWYFSGKTALTVFSAINRKIKPDLIFLFGMHLPEGSGDFIFIDDSVETPLGNLEVNREASEMLSGSFNFTEENASHYSSDNTLELQFPLIKYIFPDTSVVVIGVAPTYRAFEIGEKAVSIAERLGLSASFIGSTDLTHYGPNYGFTPEGTGKKSVQWVKEVNDKRIIDAFLRAEPGEVIKEALSSRNACCPGAAGAAIAGAGKSGAVRGTLAHYTTSYDIHPDQSFVGYAGVVY
ncbi:MAG TPA: AmmeMemoRadiSam system protein B [Spirochaetes bacterium]|nr:AmmeMemoRadiSam system protein B [Spirochaetota bacterium]